MRGDQRGEIVGYACFLSNYIELLNNNKQPTVSFCQWVGPAFLFNRFSSLGIRHFFIQQLSLENGFPLTNQPLPVIPTGNPSRHSGQRIPK